MRLSGPSRQSSILLDLCVSLLVQHAHLRVAGAAALPAQQGGYSYPSSHKKQSRKPLSFICSFALCRTPTYMSPAQLHRRPNKEGYSGTAVDVWAAGVLLTVMLLGASLDLSKSKPGRNWEKRSLGNTQAAAGVLLTVMILGEPS